MIVENREKFIKRLKLSSNVIKFIFAKSLFSLGEITFCGGIGCDEPFCV